MATVVKRNDTYRITVSSGYDSEGKQIRRTSTWKPAPGMTSKQIEKELTRQATLFEEKCRSGLIQSDNITLYDFCEKWLSEYAERSRALRQRRWPDTKTNCAACMSGLGISISRRLNRHTSWSSIKICGKPDFVGM